MKKNDIKIKFKIADVDTFLEKLRKNKYILIGGTFEKTTRYDFEDERLARSGIFIKTKNGLIDIRIVKKKYLIKNKKSILKEKMQHLK